MSRAAPVLKVGIVFVGIFLMVGAANAANITIYDNDAGGVFGTPGASDNRPTQQEDQEVQANCVTDQTWDLEGMFLDTSTDIFSMVGGWNFSTGLPSTVPNDGNPPTNRYTSGDIFIALGTAPVYGAGTPANSLMATYGYDYVLDVDWLTGLYTVYSSAPSTPVTLVYYAQNNEANPWARASGGTAVASGTFAQTGPLTNAQTGFNGGTHYQTSTDLSWLASLGVDYGTPVWFHFTEECGNDNLMGFVNTWDPTPLNPVPEPASIALLGMGALGLVVTRFRTRLI